MFEGSKEVKLSTNFISVKCIYEVKNLSYLKKTFKIMKKINLHALPYLIHLVLEIFRLMRHSNEITYDVKIDVIV